MLSAAETMEMRGVEFKARRFVLVKKAVYKAAPVRIHAVIFRCVDKVQPFLDFAENALRFNRSFRGNAKRQAV